MGPDSDEEGVASPPLSLPVTPRQSVPEQPPQGEYDRNVRRRITRDESYWNARSNQELGSRRGSPTVRALQMDSCLARLRAKLPFGDFRWTTVKYTGAEIRQHEDFSIEVCQEAYIDKLEEVSTKPYGKSSATLPEPSLMRACCGQLAWVANHSRPDQAFLASRVSRIRLRLLILHFSTKQFVR